MEGSLESGDRYSNAKNHATGGAQNGNYRGQNMATETSNTIHLLLERSSCSLKLKRYEEVISDCKQIVDLEPGVLRPQVQSRLVYSLFRTGRFAEARQLLVEWVKRKPKDVMTRRTLEKILSLLKRSPDDSSRKEMLQLTENDSIAISNKFVSQSSILPHFRDLHLQDVADGGCRTFECKCCKLEFLNEANLNVHWRSEAHLVQIISDGDKKWEQRPPPRGVSAEQYQLCECVVNEESCRLGEQCTDAHSEVELLEWKERFEYRQKKMDEARDSAPYDDYSSYTDKLLEKLLLAKNPSMVMKDMSEDVEVTVDPPTLNMTVSSKQSTMQWTFTFASDNKKLRRVVLLHDAHRSHFEFLSVSPMPDDAIASAQEWVYPDAVTQENLINKVDYVIELRFSTNIFGTFRQTIVFDYGEEPVLAKKLCVDVVPKSKLENLEQAKQTLSCSSERWHMENCDLVPFDPKPSQFMLSNEDEALLLSYPMPQPGQCVITQAIMEPKITSRNYCNRLHELLQIEEMAQFEQLSRFNISAKLQLVDRYLIMQTTNSTAKYTVNGELYAQLMLESELSEDTAAGRLVLTNCNSVLISIETAAKKNSDKRRVYEVLIEDRGKDVIYLRLSNHCVTEFNLLPNTDLSVQVQFQLNRIPMCEMHLAVDKISSDASFIFPDTSTSPHIPWNPNKQWNELLDDRLNPKQKEAVLAITSVRDIQLPPILLIGPFGTGKTFTLAQAIKQIVCQPHTRVLVCTHSNSAADLYIKDYLHDFCKMCPEATPLRIFYRNRWVQTVDSTVLKYSLLKMDYKTGTSSFSMPTIDDVMDHRVVVTTLSTARYLTLLDLPKGFFSHILIDEAAQALECEAIMPLVLADDKTKIVMAGDHMQLSPEVFSQFCREKKLGISLLERLYDHYPVSFNCRILLCENYRSHEAIVRYTSELFYDNKLVAGGRQGAHARFFPLTFFTARGEDVQDKNSTAFYNDSEVYEVAERIGELLNSWPISWGPKTAGSIGVVAPYYDQVVKIRCELRKRKLYGVNVERVLNVQGKQFRAIFLSTVRTRYTCLPGVREDDVDYGFLSNAKLLNTAITRAQSLVAVVGDPVTLCSIGKCRKLWEKFMKTCDDNHSLYGITWNSLRSHLDGVELKKSSYVLNPLAPEFIPLRLRQEEPYLCFPFHPYLPMVNMCQPVPYQPIVYSPFYGHMMQYSAAHTMASPYPRMVQPPPQPPFPSYGMLSPRMTTHARAPMYMPSRPIYNPLPYGSASPQINDPKPMERMPNGVPSNLIFKSPYQPIHPTYPVKPELMYSPRACQGYPAVHGAPAATTKICGPRSLVPNDKPVLSPAVSPSGATARHHPQISPPAKASAIEKRCELYHYFQMIGSYIPPDCNLDLLLKTPMLRMPWLNYVQKFKGLTQAQELHKLLETAHKLEAVGHTLPPLVGDVPCRICTPNRPSNVNRGPALENVTPPPPPPMSVQNDSSRCDKLSYRHVLLNGKELISGTDVSPNGHADIRTPTRLPKVMTVEELEATFMNEAETTATYPIDVVSQILDDGESTDDSSVSESVPPDKSLLYRLHRKAPGNTARSNSWTPTLGLPHGATKKRNSCYNLQSSLSRDDPDSSRWRPSDSPLPVSPNPIDARSREEPSSSNGGTAKQPMTYAGAVRSVIHPRTRRDDSPSRRPLSIVQDLKGTSGFYHYFT